MTNPPVEAREADFWPLLDAVFARLIPGDASGPGAREANVLAYARRALVAHHHAALPAVTAGLKMLDTRAVEASGAGFLKLSEEEQDALLSEAERRGARELASRSDSFFATVRTLAIEGMFGDPAWGGNARGVGWNLVGYPGPRRGWTAEEQALESMTMPSQAIP